MVTDHYESVYEKKMVPIATFGDKINDSNKSPDIEFFPALQNPILMQMIVETNSHIKRLELCNNLDNKIIETNFIVIKIIVFLLS